MEDSTDRLVHRAQTWRIFYNGFRAMGCSMWFSALRAFDLARMEPIDRVRLGALYVTEYQTDDSQPCRVLKSRQVKALKDMRKLIGSELKACGDTVQQSVAGVLRLWRTKPWSCHQIRRDPRTGETVVSLFIRRRDIR